MKSRCMAVLLIAGALSGWSAAAQESPPPPPPKPESGLSEPEPQPSPHVFVDRWLERLKNRDPAEYKRLSELRESDPDRFRETVHSRLQEQRRRFSQEGEGPGHRRPFGPPEGDGSHSPPGMEPGESGESGDPALRELREKARDLSVKYRQATNDATRAEIRVELRSILEHVFDDRLARREAALKQAETDIERLRTLVVRQRAQRNEIIESRLIEMTVGDPMAW